MLYVGRRWLGYTDEQIWRLTPRQFYSQLTVHQEITKRMYGGADTTDNSSPTGFIDQIPGW